MLENAVFGRRRKFLLCQVMEGLFQVEEGFYGVEDGLIKKMEGKIVAKYILYHIVEF